MKKMLLLAGLIGCSAGAVQAQSNVTVYGVVDLGLDYTNNVGGKTSYQLASGYAQGSRLGFKGTEDLGDGLSALFQLENGFAADTGALGQGGLLFGRQAFVGLSSKNSGTITAGRQYDSVVDYAAGLTANGNWGGYLFSHPLDNDNTDNSFRVNNSVKYASPTLNGFQFGGLYGFGEAAGASAKNRTYSAGASYTNGPLVLGLGYLNANTAGSTSSGAITTTDANLIANSQKIWVAGVNYTLGDATYGFVYSRNSLSTPSGANGYISSFAPATGTLTSLKFSNYELNFKYQFNPAFYVGAMYTYTVANYNTTLVSAKPKWSTVGLMADYNLSKRTDLYVQTLYEKVGGDTTGTSLDTAYIPGSAGSASGNAQLVLRAAIRHKF